MSDADQAKYVARLRRFQKDVPENKKCFVTLARVRRFPRCRARCARRCSPAFVHLPAMILLRSSHHDAGRWSDLP